jgi:predicted alpha-1,2-mannosidase
MTYARFSQVQCLQLVFLLVVAVISAPATAQKADFTRYVNPFIGTGGHGHTYPGATVPFGLVQLSPDTRIDGSWDGCSGYHYSDSLIYGFSHTHLSGTGVSDYGDIHTMPVLASGMFKPIAYRTAFKHVDEKASAGYYRVKLQNGIQVELTSSTRVGMQRYQFPDHRQFVVIDQTHRDELLDHEIEVVNHTTLRLRRLSKAWATEQHVYAFMQFSAPFIHRMSPDGKQISLAFSLPKGKPLLIKTGISFTDAAGAEKNLKAEVPHWDFDRVRREARAAWQQALSKIEVSDPDTTKLVNFYTALYHVQLQPNVVSDVDGRYRGMDKRIHQAVGYQHYSIFSLWDTFRANHPLLTLIDQKRTRDFLRTFLKMYEQGGRLPVWELAGNETDCMIGYHSVSVIADAVLKNIDSLPARELLPAMVHSARLQHLGLAAYQQNRQITADDEHENVSKQLEYAYDDWCIARMAEKLGETELAADFYTRAQYWKNLFDPSTGFFRPKQNGGWLSPFDPFEVNNHYTEGNAWQYAFFVPHDVGGLMSLHGGPAAFEQRLDALFTAPTATTGRQQADITGLIGQYAHGNEPSHHMAFLYLALNKPAKTQVLVDSILRHFYTNAPDGLIGNEDCGQMSAWYVLSSMGLYQVAPGDPHFVSFAPHLQQVRMRFENGKSLQINSKGVKGSMYASALTVNGKPQKALARWAYADLLQGGNWQYELSQNAAGSLPAASWPEAAAARLVVNPVIEASGRVFKGLQTVRAFHPTDSNVLVLASTDSNAALLQQNWKSQTIELRQSSLVRAQAIDLAGKQSSAEIKASYYLLPADRQVSLQSSTHSQYGASGASSLIDGLLGSENWRKGDWLGFFGQPLKAELQFDQPTNVSQLGLRCLQETRAWIVYPTRVSFYGSTDGKRFELLGTVNNTVPANDYAVQTQTLLLQLKEAKSFKALRVLAEPLGPLPAWHLSAGEQAYIFVDEWIIR